MGRVLRQLKYLIMKQFGSFHSFLVTLLKVFTKAETICKVFFYWSIYFLNYGNFYAVFSQFELFRQRKEVLRRLKSFENKTIILDLFLEKK